MSKITQQRIIQTFEDKYQKKQLKELKVAPSEKWTSYRKGWGKKPSKFI